MEKYILFLICSRGYDLETRTRCGEILKSTIKEWELYQSVKEKEKEYREFAENKLSRPGFWVTTTLISSISTQKLYLTGHNVAGIDAVNLKLGRESEISLSWRF